VWRLFFVVSTSKTGSVRVSGSRVALRDIGQDESLQLPPRNDLARTLLSSDEYVLAYPSNKHTVVQ
jgi:hypothetical protein